MLLASASIPLRVPSTATSRFIASVSRAVALATLSLSTLAAFAPLAAAQTAHFSGAVITLRGGGCIRNTDLACVFRANGVVIRDYENLKSPDWDGVAGNCVVNLADLVRFAPNTDLCFDYNNSGGVDLSDVVTFVSGFTPAHHCP